MITFHHPCRILKASQEGEDRIKIVIKASTEGPDREGEVILKSAFEDPQMQQDFLKTGGGYYDYNHLTDIIDERMRGASGQELVALQKSKIEAMIGYPETLEVREDGVYSTGYLYPDNPFVKEILKSLLAGYKGWGASISGYTTKSNKDGNKIKRLVLRKIAIAPLQEVINPETSVLLAKSVLLRDINKSEFFQSDSNPGDTTGGVNEQELNELKLKTDILFGFMLRNPTFQAELATDVESVLKSNTVPLAHDEIVAYVRTKYGIDQKAASAIANGALLDFQKN